MKKDEANFLIIIVLALLCVLVLFGEKPKKLINSKNLFLDINGSLKKDQPKSHYVYYETGKASWYGSKHQGRKMVNGDRFNPDSISFAHKKIPINTIVRITNLENGESVIGPLTDRGPYARSRVIDVSEKAANTLGFKKKGLALVKIEVLNK